MFNGSHCDRKSQLSGILTEPLNPRGSGVAVQWGLATKNQEKRLFGQGNIPTSLFNVKMVKCHVINKKSWDVLKKETGYSNQIIAMNEIKWK